VTAGHGHPGGSPRPGPWPTGRVGPGPGVHRRQMASGPCGAAFPRIRVTVEPGLASRSRIMTPVMPSGDSDSPLSNDRAGRDVAGVRAGRRDSDAPGGNRASGAALGRPSARDGALALSLPRAHPKRPGPVPTSGTER
jgi:hypothetical protein